MTVSISAYVNGEQRDADIDPRRHLADFLRQDLGLTGTHLGCEHGVCGACTVLLDGAPVRACLVLAAQVDGAKIETVESLGSADALHPLQAAFKENHALQCGFCTPGMLMTLKYVLDSDPDATRETVEEALSGNLCRCTGYAPIVEAALSAAKNMQGAVDE